jgi:hypothetical protein
MKLSFPLFCSLQIIPYTPHHHISSHRVHTEWPLSGVHSIVMGKSALTGEGGRCTLLSLYLPSCTKLWCTPQSTHSVATAAFWRAFHHGGKLAHAGEGGGCHALPLLLYLPSRTKLQCTLQLRGQIFSPYFYFTPICTLCFKLLHCRN